MDFFGKLHQHANILNMSTKFYQFLMILNPFFNKGKEKNAKGVRGTAKGGSPAVSVMIIIKKN